MSIQIIDSYFSIVTFDHLLFWFVFTADDFANKFPSFAVFVFCTSVLTLRHLLQLFLLYITICLLQLMLQYLQFFLRLLAAVLLTYDKAFLYFSMCTLYFSVLFTILWSSTYLFPVIFTLIGINISVSFILVCVRLAYLQRIVMVYSSWKSLFCSADQFQFFLLSRVSLLYKHFLVYCLSHFPTSRNGPLPLSALH